jgi:hypothetical protein
VSNEEVYAFVLLYCKWRLNLKQDDFSKEMMEIHPEAIEAEDHKRS